ncbi:RNase E specificity factor CsrD [Photobacterium carnosum]|uniref:RNase E specificity factor CsrD n=1 Tax=Photobacterium carnosum TaxID=2023717 RepID=UPI001E2D1686|nr:RNase E specificity factor CsrD [Photobacterium carnosum]MCD9494784.1 RNase E specificity factor CsrD [Photobacterium carnosum]MCD9499544.1 RNase E specificity factor CsrD [Photobacterium carnosum]MCD9522453.1 RNase E specificity factor CsrD [Photobacterium carnosum]MCD9529948.1 RNase E specificity factor CsrD [Photobacterium carnosum]MCD9545486.1 RNase E specificity factor CsrD [Photobacterium carnosum]
MRKASRMKLTNRLVAFVTMIVICAILVIFIGGALSFRKLGQDSLVHYLDGVVTVIDQELADPQGAQALPRWLPTLLQASNVVTLTINDSKKQLFDFKGSQIVPDPNVIYHHQYQLPSHPGYQVTITAIPLYSEFTYSLGAMSSISLAMLIVILGLIRGVHWLRTQLHGSELLEERGRMILAGRVEQYAEGNDYEWPATASLALDQLIGELKDARQERSRFDTFIRTHTFLDQLTGTANRVLFDSRLQSMVQDQDSHGAVVLLRLSDWDEMCAQQGRSIADELLQDISVILSNFIQRFPDTVLARYFDAEFAILIPQQPAKEIKIFTHQLLNAVERLSPPPPMEKDNWCHIGVTYFHGGDRRGRIMDEVDTALRSSQLQGANSWNSFNKDHQWDKSRGNVRWRTLIDKTLIQGGPLLYQQPIIMAENEQIMSYALLARIQDDNGDIIKASHFMSAVEQVGYSVRFDRAVITQTLLLLKQQSADNSYAVNITTISLRDKKFVKWLRDELLQLPRPVLNRLLFEVSESMLVKHLDTIRPVLRVLTGLGCKLIVSQAGRTIVSTYYIKDIKADYIKLHRGLVRDIHQRQENQLFVRSMLGACANSDAKVIAVGVETNKEWRVLQQLGVVAAQGRLFAAEIRI